jgi:hypothetical protein
MIDKRSFKKSMISIGLTAMLSTTLLAQSAYAQPWVHEDVQLSPLQAVSPTNKYCDSVKQDGSVLMW